jgi:hypothetical protein
MLAHDELHFSLSSGDSSRPAESDAAIGVVAPLAAALANIRVGTFVYASPVRPPWITAWEAHSLSVLTEGPFEMGVGTGRPGIENQLRELGLPVVPPSGRLAQVRETVRAPPDTDPAALRAVDSLAVLPDDPAAAAEEIQRRREEMGFSYVVVGAAVADTLATVVADLAGR